MIHLLIKCLQPSHTDQHISPCSESSVLFLRAHSVPLQAAGPSRPHSASLKQKQEVRAESPEAETAETQRLANSFSLPSAQVIPCLREASCTSFPLLHSLLSSLPAAVPKYLQQRDGVVPLPCSRQCSTAKSQGRNDTATVNRGSEQVQARRCGLQRSPCVSSPFQQRLAAVAWESSTRNLAITFPRQIPHNSVSHTAGKKGSFPSCHRSTALSSHADLTGTAGAPQGRHLAAYLLSCSTRTGLETVPGNPALNLIPLGTSLATACFPKRAWD